MNGYLNLGVVLVTAIGAFTDFRSARLPNSLTYSALAMALLLRGALMGWPGLKSGAIGIAIAGGLFCVLFAMGAMGGGDMKMMAAVGAWVGSAHVVTVIVVIALAGGVLALISTILNGHLLRTLRNIVQLVMYRLSSGLQPHPEMNVQVPSSARIPFGVAIAMGTLFCALNFAWWR